MVPSSIGPVKWPVSQFAHYNAGVEVVSLAVTDALMQYVLYLQIASAMKNVSALFRYAQNLNMLIDLPVTSCQHWRIEAFTLRLNPVFIAYLRLKNWSDTVAEQKRTAPTPDPQAIQLQRQTDCGHGI